MNVDWKYLNEVLDAKLYQMEKGKQKKK